MESNMKLNSVKCHQDDQNKRLALHYVKKDSCYIVNVDIYNDARNLDFINGLGMDIFEAIFEIVSTIITRKKGFDWYVADLITVIGDFRQLGKYEDQLFDTFGGVYVDKIWVDINEVLYLY